MSKTLAAELDERARAAADKQDRQTSLESKARRGSVSDREFKSFILRGVPSLQAVASKYLDPERLIRIALVARSRTPKLRECTPESFLAALMDAAQVGLEVETPMGHAALVPRYNKNTGTYEAQFQPMYRGLLELARRSGVLRDAWVRVVYEHDRFEHIEGLSPHLEHVPSRDRAGRGAPIAAYAVFDLGDRRRFEVMYRDEIEAVRRRSATDDGPWQTDWEEMAKKTVLKRGLKMLATGSDVATAIAVDDGNENGSRPVDDAALMLEEGGDGR